MGHIGLFAFAAIVAIFFNRKNSLLPTNGVKTTTINYPYNTAASMLSFRC